MQACEILGAQHVPLNAGSFCGSFKKLEETLISFPFLKDVAERWSRVFTWPRHWAARLLSFASEDTFALDHQDGTVLTPHVRSSRGPENGAFMKFALEFFGHTLSCIPQKHARKPEVE